MCNADLYHWWHASLLKRQTGYRVNLLFWNIYVEITQPPDVSLQHDADVSLPADNTPALYKLRCLGAIALLSCLVAFLISRDSCTPALSEQRHSWPVLCFDWGSDLSPNSFKPFPENKLISDFNMLVCKTSKMTTKIYLKIMIVKLIH